MSVRTMTVRCRTIGLILITLLLPARIIAAPTTTASDEKRVVKALFDNLEVAFPVNQGCGQDIAKPVTVGDYVQTTLIFLSQEPAGESRVRVNCSGVKNDRALLDYYQALQGEQANALSANLRQLKKTEPLKQCAVSFNHQSQENVWSRSVQFLIREKTGQAIAHSFRCLTTP